MREREITKPRDNLYALPDHQVVAALLPDAGCNRIDSATAAHRIARIRGMVPLAIDPRDGGQVIWGDLGEHPFREWQYIFTIADLVERGAITEVFSCPIDILDHDALFAQGLWPSGFIHHVSRCGSTLTAKALARPEGHMMVSQGAPLQRGFWAWASGEWSHPLEPRPEVLRRLRNLVLAMTRPRRGDERRAFVKFISWNILYADIIAQALPGVPTIFLYRDPVEVIASVKKATTAALLTRGTAQGAFLTGIAAEKTRSLGDADYLAACYARYFEVAARSKADLSLVNYRDLGAYSFAMIVENGLHFHPTPNERLAMLEQFRYHSKDDSNSSRFTDDSARKQSLLSQDERAQIESRCEGLMENLDNSPKNLFVHQALSKTGTISETFARTRP